MSKDANQGCDEAPPVIVAITGLATQTQSLEQLLGRLPAQQNAALIVVLQHREALVEEPLRQAVAQGWDDLAEIADGTPVETGRLYLVPEGVIATLEDGGFRCRPADQTLDGRGVIDSFLVSLADEHGKQAVVVALDGTDGDGTLGVKEIKGAGGFVLAEDTPESRANALASSEGPAALADDVLPVEDLVPRLAALIEQLAQRSEPEAVSAFPNTPEIRESLGTIASILRQKTGHDFHDYKTGTFLRRVQRRMQVLQLDEIPDYIEALRATSAEAQNLFNDLLIGVTEFFRDKREWDLLEHEVIPRLFQGKGGRDVIRVWVVGCSTGEEAYSLGILLAEERARVEDAPQIQIFASDLDGRALASARAGRYTDSIAQRMSAERLARWFVKEGDTYHITKELRELCVFSQHSLIKDAPFSRLDLVSCRNLLIYLDAELQKRVIPLFHFALRPGGVLFLGNSENASRHQDFFAPVESRSRIFNRLEGNSRPLLDFPFTAVDRRWRSPSNNRVAALTAPDSVMEASDLTRWAEREAEQYAPAFVLLDRDHNVLHFSGNMGRYLAPSRGAASLNMLQLVHPALRLDLRAALARAADEGQPVELRDLEFAVSEVSVAVDLVVKSRQREADNPAGFLVLFKEAMRRSKRAEPGPLEPVRDQGEHVLRLEDELRQTRDRLQAAIEELESTNEELKSSNEEYQSLNEELQSANEELETSKEELQSVNEELTTLNGELAHRVQELGRANSDLKNFLEASQIATLFLDNDLRVTNFTPAIVEVFHLVDADEGRPIVHIKSRVSYDELQDDARRVLRTLAPIDREVDDRQTGARYIVRVLPYRSTDNVIAGVVMTFVDVTARREAEEQLRESEERFRAIVETATNYAIFTTDTDGRIEAWPPGAESVFGWTAEEAVGQPVDMTFTPEDRAAGVPDNERQEAREAGQAINVRWHLRKGGARIFIEGVQRPLTGPGGKVTGFVKVGQDVTERQATQEALRESERRFRFLTEGIPQLVWRAADYGNWTWASPQWTAFTGQTKEESLGWGWLEALHPDDREGAREAWERARTADIFEAEYRLREAATGTYRWFQTRATPVYNEERRILEWLGTSTDVQDLREMQDRQGVMVAELQHRTRNLMGVVRSLGEQTIRSSKGLEDFVPRFRDRLAALGRANNLLSRLGEGKRLAFDELIEAEIAALGEAAQQDGKVTLNGPKGVALRSSGVQTFSLALHELATNALKYGALAQPKGRLEISWQVRNEADQPWLHVDWRETGVTMPEADAAPRGEGAGRLLIEEALPYQLGARTTFTMTPEGVHCTIALPASERGTPKTEKSKATTPHPRPEGMP